MIGPSIAPVYPVVMENAIAIPLPGRNNPLLLMQPQPSPEEQLAQLRRGAAQIISEE
jgi:hypothetical protein